MPLADAGESTVVRSAMPCGATQVAVHGYLTPGSPITLSLRRANELRPSQRHQSKGHEQWPHHLNCSSTDSDQVGHERAAQQRSPPAARCSSSNVEEDQGNALEGLDAWTIKVIGNSSMHRRREQRRDQLEEEAQRPTN